MPAEPSPLLVMPVCARDIELALRNLDLCHRWDGRSGHDVLVCTPEGFDATTLLSAAAKCFSRIATFSYPEWPGVPGWPQSPNWAWQQIALYIRGSLKRPWFWWEADATPLRPGWFTALCEAYASGNQPYAGHVTEAPYGRYMNGVGFYPANFRLPAAMQSREEPFDFAAGVRDGLVGHCHQLNHLIACDPNTRSQSFYDKSDLDSLLSTGAVIFHHCKDGSLYQLLTGRPGAVRPTGITPSFLEQTTWPSGLFAFPVDPYTCYYNPSLVTRDSTDYLFTRRHRYLGGWKKPGNKSDLVIWRLSPYLSPIEPFIPELPARYQNEQWEDPRALIGPDGSTMVVFANWCHGKPWHVRQSLVRLDHSWRRALAAVEPHYGGTHSLPDRAKSPEKNWMPFYVDSTMHLVYSINPHVVFSVDASGRVLGQHKQRQVALPWPYGELRGGTPPIRVGDEYLAFFHSSTIWQPHLRRYYMGAYTFDAQPPFTIRRITVEPLLTGSEKDARANSGPLVIFPCGAKFSDSTWLVTFGVNDEACGWIKIPHADLNKKLKMIDRDKPMTFVERVKDAFNA